MFNSLNLSNMPRRRLWLFLFIVNFPSYKLYVHFAVDLKFSTMHFNSVAEPQWVGGVAEPNESEPQWVGGAEPQWVAESQWVVWSWSPISKTTPEVPLNRVFRRTPKLGIRTHACWNGAISFGTFKREFLLCTTISIYC